MSTTHHAVKMIREEHEALRAVLHSVSYVIASARDRCALPDFKLLRSMLLYVVEFPERFHHTKENHLLFPRIRERCPPFAPVLDRLEAEHERGESGVRDLEHALAAFELLGETRRIPFEEAAMRFVEGYLGHMEVEEQYILPVAEEYLTESDWSELDAAFATHRDPLAGADLTEGLLPLMWSAPARPV